MKETNSYTNFIEKIGVLKVANIGTLFALLFINANMLLSNPTIMDELRQIAPSIATPVGVVVSSVAVTLLLVLFTYLVLKMIFRVSIDAFDNGDVLLICLTSMVYGSLYLAVLGLFGVNDVVARNLGETVVSSVGVFAMTYFLVEHYRKTLVIPQKSLVTFYVLFGIYTIVDIAFIFVRFYELI